MQQCLELMCGVWDAQPVTLQLALESEFAGKVHPLVLRLGLDYAEGKITGGNARCVALLATLRQVMQVGNTFPRQHLSTCRHQLRDDLLAWMHQSKKSNLRHSSERIFSRESA